MTVTEPIIARAVFGLPESAFPPDGLPHRAVWPVIQSAPDRRFSTVTTSVRSPYDLVVDSPSRGCRCRPRTLRAAAIGETQRGSQASSIRTERSYTVKYFFIVSKGFSTMW